MNVKSAGYSVHTKPYFSLRNKSLPHYLLRFQSEGVCQVAVNRTVYAVEPGHMLLCKPGDLYELMIPLEAGGPPLSADYYIALQADDAWLRQWWERCGQKPLVQLGMDETVLAMMQQMVQEKRRLKDSDPLILEYLARALLLHIQRQCGTSVHGNAYERSVANQIKLYIERNAAGPLTLKQIAASAGLSISRASQLFKTALHQSIMDYAIEVRLTMAKERMLDDGMTLQEIAEMCGFATYPHFNRLFRARFGMSPSEYSRSLHG